MAEDLVSILADLKEKETLKIVEDRLMWRRCEGVDRAGVSYG